MTKLVDQTVEALRNLCNDAMDNNISDEEFFRKSMAFFLPERKSRKLPKAPKARKAKRGMGSY